MFLNLISPPGGYFVVVVLLSIPFQSWNFCIPCAREREVWGASGIVLSVDSSTNEQKSPESQGSFYSWLGTCLGMAIVPGVQERQSSSCGWKQACWAPLSQKLMWLKFPNYFAVSFIIIRKMPAQDVILGVNYKCCQCF